MIGSNDVRPGLCRGVLMQALDLCLVEGAGGWKVPVNDRELLSDLVRALGLPVILVVGLRLGCINHALLSAQAILLDGLPLAGWIANCVDPDMPAREDNLASLTARIPAPLLATITHRPGPDADCAADIDLDRLLAGD